MSRVLQQVRGEGSLANRIGSADDHSSDQVGKLHSVLRPFMLRRVKADVEHGLPLKREILLYAPMAPHQRRLNEQLCDGTVSVRLARSSALTCRCTPVNVTVQTKKK